MGRIEVQFISPEAGRLMELIKRHDELLDELCKNLREIEDIRLKLTCVLKAREGENL